MLKVYIDGNELRQSEKNGGVCGEHNSTEMLLSFGEKWSKYAKKVVFYNAHRLNPVTVMLFDPTVTADGIEEYIIRIPGEALEFEGEAEYVIEGTIVDGESVSSRKKSVCGMIKVRYSPSSESEELPDEAAATIAEQLQTEAKRISEMADNMVPYIGDNGNWIVYNPDEREWQDTGILAKGKKGDKGEPGEKGDKGEPGKDGKNPSISAQQFDTAVMIEFENGDGTKGSFYVYNGHSPRIGDNGNWYAWDRETEAFVDTGVKAEGYTPVKGTDYWTDEDKAEINTEIKTLMFADGYKMVDVITNELYANGGLYDVNYSTRLLEPKRAVSYALNQTCVAYRLWDNIEDCFGETVQLDFVVESLDGADTVQVLAGAGFYSPSSGQLCELDAKSTSRFGAHSFKTYFPEENTTGSSFLARYEDAVAVVYIKFYSPTVTDDTALIVIEDTCAYIKTKTGESFYEKVAGLIPLPHIGDNGNWYAWDRETEAFVDTGVKAEGYTPVRGTDYWTDEDKEEIKGYVDDEIGDIEVALENIITKYGLGGDAV